MASIAIPSNDRVRRFHSTTVAAAGSTRSGPLIAVKSSHSSTRRLGSTKGSGFSSTALTRLKIAVFAPMPSASVRIAIAVKTGLPRSVRSA